MLAAKIPTRRLAGDAKRAPRTVVMTVVRRQRRVSVGSLMMTT
jgi:hypothetical protein